MCQHLSVVGLTRLHCVTLGRLLAAGRLWIISWFLIIISWFQVVGLENSRGGSVHKNVYL